MSQTEPLMVRVSPELRAQIELAAAEERRSLSATIRNVLADWVTERVVADRPAQRVSRTSP
jgi:predicted HicB family RNase H-like nuclease